MIKGDVVQIIDRDSVLYGQVLIVETAGEIGAIVTDSDLYPRKYIARLEQLNVVGHTDMVYVEPDPRFPILV